MTDRSPSAYAVVDAEELAPLAAVPAPTGGEEARVSWLEQRLAATPGRRYRHAVGNLIWAFTDRQPGLLVMAHLGAPLGGVKGGDEAPTPVQRWLDVESFISHRITLDEAWGFELMEAQNGIRSVIEFS